MKVNLKPKAMMYPSPAVIASAYDSEGEVDACTLAFAAPCSHFPPAVVIAINSTLKRKTLVDILEIKEFSLGFPSISQMEEADYFGIDSSYDVDKLEMVGWSYKKADLVNAPIINDLKVSLECKVINVCEVGSHTQITGEIVNVQADEDVLDDDGKISFEKLNPLVYDVFKRNYFKTGEKIGDSYNVGLKFKK